MPDWLFIVTFVIFVCFIVYDIIMDVRESKNNKKHNPLAHPERYLDDTMAIVDDMTMAQRKELLKYLENKIEGNKEPITKEEWEDSTDDLH